MKVALITPSNLIHMPYVKLYTSILDDAQVEYDIFNWDRCQIESLSENCYRNKNANIRKSFTQYWGYARFIKRKLQTNEYDLIIIFGLQMLFFLQQHLHRFYKGRYILDIRDRNTIIKFLNMKRIVGSAKKIIISSPGFKQWLPIDNYLISHNIKTRELNKDIERKPDNILVSNRCIDILSIGTIRDSDINQKLILQLKNNQQFQLSYCGDGFVIEKLKEVVEENQIKNVRFRGRYLPEEENKIVQDTDFVSVLMFDNSENNLTLLPNRLYVAVFNFKPLLAYHGTYTGEIIKKYHLGLVIKNLENLDQQILAYKNNFNRREYLEGRKRFLQLIMEENSQFQKFLVTSTSR